MDEKVFRVALARLGQPQIWVAHKLDRDPATVNRWARNWQQVPEQMQSRIAELLEVRMTELFPDKKVEIK